LLNSASFKNIFLKFFSMYLCNCNYFLDTIGTERRHAHYEILQIWRINFLTPRQRERERETQCLLRLLVARPKNMFNLILSSHAMLLKILMCDCVFFCSWIESYLVSLTSPKQLSLKYKEIFFTDSFWLVCTILSEEACKHAKFLFMFIFCF